MRPWLPPLVTVLLCACAIPHDMATLSPAEACRRSTPVAGAAEESTERPAISWLGPTHGRDVEKLAEWCATVGPPVTVRASEAGALWTGDSLLVATWNVGGRKGRLLDFLEGRLEFDCDRADRGRHFVLLLQEVVRRSDRVPRVPDSDPIPPRLDPPAGADPETGALGLARRCGLALVYVPSMRNGAHEYDGGREDRGNAILSSLPLEGVLAIELPFEAQRRVAVAATVRASSGDSIRVVSLHLDTTVGVLRTLRTGNSSRLRQALGLIEALARAERSARRAERLGRGRGPAATHPVSTLVAGDLNSWSDHETVIRHLRAYFPDSPEPDGLPTRAIFPADHLFYRQSVDRKVRLVPGSYRREDDRCGSDHFPRTVWVEIADRASLLE